MPILMENQSVHGATRKTLLKIKGFSEVKVEKIKEAIQKCLVSSLSTPPSRMQHDLTQLAIRVGIHHSNGAVPPAKESCSHLHWK